VKKIWFLFVLIALLGAGCALTPPAIVSFSVEPSNINAGQSATLTWTVNNASLVKIDPFSGNQYPSGSTVVSPSATTTYVLIASNAGGSVTATALLTVNTQVTPSPAEPVSPKPTIPAVSNFTVAPTSINAGDSATLEWDVTGATSVFIEPDIGSVALSGSKVVAPTYSTNYVLTASNAGNTIASLVTLNINPYPPYLPSSQVPYPSALLGALPQVNFFDINPPIINAGSSTTIKWDISNADNVFIDNGIGDVSQSGTMTITPSATTIYTITASSLYGSSSSSATIMVNPTSKVPVITSFSGSPISITTGGSSTLQWNVTGATSVSIDQGIGMVPSSGARSVSPIATTKYTLTATDNAGSVVASTTVIVSPTSGTPAILSFTSDPGSVLVGKSSILEWNVTGAKSVFIDQGIGTVPLSGTKLVSPSSPTVYTLTATNSLGSVSSSATVTITQPTSLPLILSFSIYPTSIQPGDSATLQWQTGGATSVSIDQGVGTVAQAGQLQVSPADTTTYTLTATNDAGSVTAAVTLTVIVVTGQPFIVSFSASPTVIPLGDSATLQWQVTGATSVSITPGIGTISASGTRVVEPTQMTTYILTARNSAGVTTHTAQLAVTFLPQRLK
jgi:hypothetical protein